MAVDCKVDPAQLIKQEEDVGQLALGTALKCPTFLLITSLIIHSVLKLIKIIPFIKMHPIRHVNQINLNAEIKMIILSVQTQIYVLYLM